MPTLHWIGKEKVVNHHQDVPFRVLEHVYGFRSGDAEDRSETGSGNKIIHGDNLEALKALLPEYEGRVKCIYIDPPYNTGNEKWVYNDNVNDPRIKKWLGEVVGKQGEDLSRHDKWLCMMYPRLRLLHKLLSEDGAIFISIDDSEQGNLRLLCDEIFGSNNFINNIIWEKKYAPSNDAKWLSDNHDFILVYAKNKSIWRPNLLPRNDEMNSRYKNMDNDPRGVWKAGDCSVKTYSAANDYPITTPSGRVVNPPAGYCWRFSEAKFAELVADNRIWFGKDGNNVPSIKRFLTDVKDGITSMTIWRYTDVGHNQDAKKEVKLINPDDIFDTPKPTSLLSRILQIGANKDSIVLDSFAGSGTTAHAVMQLNQKDGGNRKFILVEMMDYAETITAERVRRVANGYGDVDGLGGEFDYYELGEPMFDKDKNLNEVVGEDKIREYIYYTETKQHLERERREDSRYLLDTYNDTGYYFYYDKDNMTTLSIDTLNIVTERAEQYVIYADRCVIDKEDLASKGIVFKKIPRDIKRF